MSETPKFNEFCWNELATTNVKAAKDFYGKLFGWEFTEHDLGDFTYTMIRKKDQHFAGIWQIPKDQEKEIPPHWMAYVLVENVDDSLEKARKNGATIIKPTSKAGDFGLFAIIQDPTGAHLALWQNLMKM